MNLPLGSRFLAGLTALVTVSLSAAAAPTPTDYWVYFGTYTDTKSKGIYVSRMDQDGHLTAPELASIALNPAFLAVEPHHAFLYAANETDHFRGEKSGAVTAYAINAATGRLARLNQQSTHGAGPAHVAVDATGHMVVAANYNGGSETAFPVNADGSLGAASVTIQNHGSSINPARQAAPHAHCVAFDPANRFAFVCDLGLDQVLSFRIDPTTAGLVPNEPAFVKVAPGSGPRHIAFRPDGRFAYVINELACTMTVFAFEPDHGTLRQIETVSTLPAGDAGKTSYSTAEIAVHPSGKYVYGANRGHNTIVVFASDEATGRLTLVEHVSSGGAVPRSFGIDPTGRFLLAANEDSGNVDAFAIDAKTGRLMPTGDSIAVAKPVSAVFVPVTLPTP